MSLDPNLAKAVYIRDSWKCRHCNDRNALHPHHLIYKSHGGKDDLDNLITLCAQCHRAHHDGFLDIEVIKIALTVTQLPAVRFTRLKNWKPK